MEVENNPAGPDLFLVSSKELLYTALAGFSISASDLFAYFPRDSLSSDRPVFLIMIELLFGSGSSRDLFLFGTTMRTADSATLKLT